MKWCGLWLSLFFYPTWGFKLCSVSQDMNSLNSVKFIVIKSNCVSCFISQFPPWEHHLKHHLRASVEVCWTVCVPCIADSAWMVAKHSCCFKFLDFFLLRCRYFLILTLGSLYTVWVIKFSLLMEKNLVVNATCLFLLSGSCLCRSAPKYEITYRPLRAFRYEENGEAFESPPLISADDYSHRVLHALTTSSKH